MNIRRPPPDMTARRRLRYRGYSKSWQSYTACSVGNTLREGEEEKTREKTTEEKEKLHLSSLLLLASLLRRLGNYRPG